MNKLITVLAVISCGLTCVAPVHADDSALQTALQGRYAEMKVAMSARDDKAIRALLVPDFFSVDISGQSEHAAQMIREVDALPKDPNKVSTTTILAIKPAGDIVVVSQRYDMKTVKVAADGSKRDVELVTLSTDTWVKARGSWLLKKTQTDQLDYYVNGQQVAHKVRPQ